MSDASLIPKRRRYGDRAFIVDIGSHTLKIGKATSESPKLIPPCILRSEISKVGYEALKRHKQRSDAAPDSIIFPIANSLIVDWDYMERIWSHTFHSTFYVNFEETPIMVCEPVLTPKASRARLAQTFLQKFSIPAYYVGSEAKFALEHFERESGVVLDFGHSQTKIAVVVNGYTIPHCSHTSKIAGNTLDEHLLRLLAAHGVPTNRHNRELMPNIKEEHCYVNLELGPLTKPHEAVVSDPDLIALFDKNKARRSNSKSKGKTSSSVGDVKVSLGGNTLVLNQELYNVPEALFQPQMCGFGEENGVLGMVLAARMNFEAMRSHHDRINQGGNNPYNADVFKTFAIVGGSAKFPGLPERVKLEVEHLLLNYEIQKGSTVRSIDHLGLRFLSEPEEDRKGIESFLGAAVFAQTFDNANWISDVHFDQDGPEIVNRICPVTMT